MTIDYTQPPDQPGSAPPRGWWSRNWKWVVPVGCLTPILLIGGCVAGIVFFAFSAIKGTDLYEDAVVRARNDPRVIEALGGPVEAGWWVSGSVNVEGDHGTADFSVPLMGTRRKATLDVSGTRDGGEWNYSSLRVRVEDGPVIELIPAPAPLNEESVDTGPVDV